MDLKERLSERRSHSRLTQEQVADALGIPRELISMWEGGTRVPSAAHLAQLSKLYGVNEGFLLGLEQLSEDHEREVLYRGLPQDARLKMEVETWLDFLDAWGEFTGEDCLVCPHHPPRALDQGYETDARRAAALAVQVREYYRLGTDGAVDLFGFLEQLGVLVYRAPLGRPHDHDGVSGAFFNHREVGWSILVNAHMTPGRQVFTLAHELAHALYHYSKGGLVSRTRPGDPEDKKRERFANVFAGHFLAPGKAIKERLESLGGREALDELMVFRLAHLFGVSYSMMLLRLLTERFIDEQAYARYGGYDVQDIARRVGLSGDEYRLPNPDEIVWDLERYPVRVLERVRRAVEQGDLSVGEASTLLGVDGTTLQSDLLRVPGAASAGQQQELYELLEVR